MTSGDEAGAATESASGGKDSAKPERASAERGFTMPAFRGSVSATSTSAKPDSSGPASAQSAPAQSASAQSASARPAPAKPESAKAAPSKPAPSKPVNPAPAKPASSSAPASTAATASTAALPGRDKAAGGGQETGGPARAGVWAASVAVLSAALIAGLVLTGLFVSSGNGAGDTLSGERAAEAAARIAMTDLFTTSYKDPDAFAARLKPLAAGQFLNVVTNASAGFTKILTQGKLETTGQVQEVGVQQFSGTTAKVAVLAYETVKNSQTPQGSQRAFRMSLSMIKSGSKWLVSDLEFVQ